MVSAGHNGFGGDTPCSFAGERLLQCGSACKRVFKSQMTRLRLLVVAVGVVLLCGVGVPCASPLGTLSAPQAKATAVVFRAKVVSVVDGDTLHVVDTAGVPLDVRLDGIDCPESGQPFGGVARRHLRAAAFDRFVEVRKVGMDSHGRVVARVRVDGRDLSVDLLQAGLAWHYTDYSRDAGLAAAERDARTAKRGLWSEPNALPPWVWRRQPREIHVSRGPDDEAGPFVANTSSRVYHAASCQNAHCTNCTATFATASAAKNAGYRPAGDCLR